MIPVIIPATTKEAQKAAAIARKNGCRPRWSSYYGCYSCTCSELEHAVDSQCSAISRASAKRR